MKTAISIPDQVFQAAESLAQRLGVSRSQLYSKAIDEYLENHRNTGVTEALNNVYAESAASLEEEDYSLQMHSIDKEDW